jgi:hypothetical protein
VGRACSFGSSEPGRDAKACESGGERGQVGELPPAVARIGPELVLDSVTGDLSRSGGAGVQSCAITSRHSWEVILDLSGHPMTRGEGREPVVTMDSVPRSPR